MSHPLVLGVFDAIDQATSAAKAVHALGVTADELSVVARGHDEEGRLARAFDATPGADIEDSRRAGRLGELGGYLVAAVAVVLPGIGPLLAAGPLSAELGEAAGHVAGGLAAVLRRAGIDQRTALAWQGRVEQGAIVLGVHTTDGRVESIRQALATSGATAMAVARWES